MQALMNFFCSTKGVLGGCSLLTLTFFICQMNVMAKKVKVGTSKGFSSLEQVLAKFFGFGSSVIFCLRIEFLY